MSKLYINILIISSLFLYSLMVKSQERFDDVGTLDKLSGSSIVVSDSMYPISKLVDCYDQRGKKLVSCYSIKDSKWVGLRFIDTSEIKNLEVISIYELSESNYKGLTQDD